MVKRILTEFTIDKVSAVDRPAQEHALVRILKRKRPLVDDDDALNADWADQGEDERDDMDEEQPVKNAKLEHPFMRRARRMAAAHGVPLYHGMSLARQQDPQSYRHYVREGVGMSRPKIKKVAPDDVALAFQGAVDAFIETTGCSRTEAMTEVRKRAPKLWNRFRR
jgi:hypothetical protein